MGDFVDGIELSRLNSPRHALHDASCLFSGRVGPILERPRGAPAVRSSQEPSLAQGTHCTTRRFLPRAVCAWFASWSRPCRRELSFRQQNLNGGSAQLWLKKK